MENIKISYYILGNDFEDRKIALRLFDLLGYKTDIILYAYRSYANCDKFIKEFANKYNAIIIKDFTRDDIFALYFPFIESNNILYEIISRMDEQTEWLYYPQIYNAYEMLFNLKTLAERKSKKKNIIINFEAYFDMDYGMHFTFNSSNQDVIESKLLEWEKSFSDYKILKYKKINHKCNISHQ